MFLNQQEIARLPEALRGQKFFLAQINHEINTGLDARKRRWMEELDFGIKVDIVRHVVTVKNINDLLHGLRELRAYGPLLPESPLACVHLLRELVFGPNPRTLSLDPAVAHVFPVQNPEQLRCLDGLETRLFLPLVDVRRAAIEALRQTDMVYTDLQGAVPASTIMLNRNAIRGLVHHVGEATAMFSLERGGALVADHIRNLMERGILNVKIPKIADKALAGPPRPPETRRDIWWIYRRFEDPAYQKREHLKRFREAIKDFLDKSHANPPTIVLAESLVGGGSASKIIQEANNILRAYPQVRVKILLERHSVHQDNPLHSGQVLSFRPHAETANFTLFRDRSESVPLALSAIPAPETRPRDPGDPRPPPAPYDANAVQRAEVVVSDARYIIGEDVNYQLSVEGQDVHQPVFVFAQDLLGRVLAVCLTPGGPMTARDILQLLIQGAYDHVLASYGLRLQ